MSSSQLSSGGDLPVSPELLSRVRQDPQLLSLLTEQTRREVRRSLVEWATRVLADVGEVPAQHHKLIAQALTDVTIGREDRLMILAPPGSAKSTWVSKIFVPWWFCRHPRSNVLAASHTIDLAQSFGRWIRNTVSEYSTDLGFSLSEDSRAASQWATDQGGMYLAAGIGMAITGRRADLALIDDPVKSREEADSAAVREATYTWYQSSLYTRLKPTGRIVLVMTRWHEDDLAGRLIRDMRAGGDQWRIIKLCAIAEDADDPLGRAPGEALWPEWEPRDKLLRKRGVVGEREWSSQFQQRPAPAEGILFQVDKLRSVPIAPSPIAASVRGWDLAATEQVGSRDPDFTAGVRLSLLESGQFLIHRNLRHLQGTPHQVYEDVLTTAADDGDEVRISLPQDPGQAGKWQVSWLISRLAGYVVESSVETGKKETRAAPVAAQVAAGNFLIESDPVTEKLVREEMASFPAGRHDDIIDALSRAFAALIDKFSGQSMMEAMRRNLEQGGLVLDQDRELIDYYDDVRGEMEQDERPRCCRCGDVVATSCYVTDGDRHWHMECI